MAGCGCSDAGFSTTLQTMSTYVDYIEGSNEERDWSSRWTQVSFPSTPCTSPHLMQYESRKWLPVGERTAWVASSSCVDASADCGCDIHATVSRVSGASSGIMAVGDTWYVKQFQICGTTGTYRFRITRPTCGSAFTSGVIAIVVTAAAVGSPKMLTTPAGIL